MVQTIETTISGMLTRRQLARFDAAGTLSLLLVNRSGRRVSA